MDLASYEPVLEKRESNHTNVVILPTNPSDAPPAEEIKGFTLWKVKTDLAGWVTHALKSELMNAGYSIMASETAGESHPVYYIYHGSPKTENECTSIEISVQQGDEVVFKRVYQSQRPLRTSLCRLSCGLKNNLDKIIRYSFQDIYCQFVKDLNAELLLAAEDDLNMKESR